MSNSVKILNGPNLNLLGTREPHIYGTMTLSDIESSCMELSKDLNLSCTFHQSNHEGELIDLIHNCISDSISGIIINAGAFSHTSIALYDALCSYSGIVLEVHLSNIYSRESFRHHSYISARAEGIIAGFGVDGYLSSLRHLSGLLSK